MVAAPRSSRLVPATAATAGRRAPPCPARNVAADRLGEIPALPTRGAPRACEECRISCRAHCPEHWGPLGPSDAGPGGRTPAMAAHAHPRAVPLPGCGRGGRASHVRPRAAGGVDSGLAPPAASSWPCRTRWAWPCPGLLWSSPPVPTPPGTFSRLLMGLYQVLRAHRRTIRPGPRLVANLAGGLTVTLMLFASLASTAGSNCSSGPGRPTAPSGRCTPRSRPGTAFSWVWTWGLGSVPRPGARILLAWNMWQHPRFGRLLGHLGWRDRDLAAGRQSGRVPRTAGTRRDRSRSGHRVCGT